MENICITPGTRPEIIKPPPVIRACESRGMDYHILYTGQHYTYEMNGVFFEEMELPEARYNPDVGQAGGEYDGGNRGDFCVVFCRSKNK